MKKRITSLTLMIFMLMGIIMPSLSLADKNEKIKVERISGSNRYETAVKVSEDAIDKSDDIVIASGENFPDALSANGLAAQLDAPLLLVSKNTVATGIKSEIKRIGAKKAYIVGGVNVVSNSLISSLKIDTERLSGKNRYVTSELVAKRTIKLGASTDEIGLATGESFPDALSGGSYIAKFNLPLVLTNNSMPDIVNNKNRIIFGGANTINFKGLTGTRLSSSNRYDTSVEIAKAGKFNSEYAIIASGEVYADALAAITLADKEDAPILLTGKNMIQQNVLDYLKNSDIKRVIIVGGESTISENIITKIKETLNSGNIEQTDPTDPTEPSDTVDPSETDLDKLRKEPIQSLTDEQAIKVYEAQENIDINNDIFVDNTHDWTFKTKIPRENFKITKDCRILIKDNSQQYREVILPGINISKEKGHFISLMREEKPLTNAYDLLTFITGEQEDTGFFGLVTEIQIQNIHKVGGDNNKELTAIIHPKPEGMALVDTLIGWGFGTVDRDFDFNRIGIFSGIEFKEELISKENYARDNKIGIWYYK